MGTNTLILTYTMQLGIGEPQPLLIVWIHHRRWVAL